MTAHLICIKHWHSLVPEHVANSALAHACGAWHSFKERSDVSTLPIASQIAIWPLTYAPSQPQEQGQVGIRHFTKSQSSTHLAQPEWPLHQTHVAVGTPNSM